jgi:hypothetical protein
MRRRSPGGLVVDESVGRLYAGWGFADIVTLMRQMRKAVVVVMLTGAICADRAITAAPQVRPQVAQLARMLAGRLTVGLRRVVPVARVHVSRDARAALVSTLRPEPVTFDFAPVELSPFQFRLPPPVA